MGKKGMPTSQKSNPLMPDNPGGGAVLPLGGNAGDAVPLPFSSTLDLMSLYLG